MYHSNLRTDIRMYLTYLSCILNGLWLSRFGSNLLVACESVFALNRYIYDHRHHSIATNFYQMKTALIRHLYQAGYCTALTQQEQIQPCWGYRDEPCDEDCYKCGGTGIYSRHRLYAFTFAIAGRAFHWHQPQALVTWPTVMTDETVTRFEPGTKLSPELSDIQAFTHYAVIWWYLTLHRIKAKLPVPPFLPLAYLRRALKSLNDRINLATCALLSHRIYTSQYGVIYCTRCKTKLYEPPDDNEVPF